MNKIIPISLIAVVGFILIEIYLVNKFQSQVPSKNFVANSNSSSSQTSYFSFPGTLQTVKNNKFGKFIVVIFDKPIGSVTGQAFILQPVGYTNTFNLHTKQNMVKFDGTKLDQKLQALKGKRYIWNVITNSGNSGDTQLAALALSYNMCNQEFASRYQSNQLGQLTCTPFLNDATSN